MLFLELELPAQPDHPETLFERVRFAIDRIRRTQSLEAGCVALATEIRQITAFDRVMVYRFDPDWNGEVVAEDKKADAHSFNGHMFPAADIPSQARALYSRNTIRLIPDARRAPSPVFPTLLPATGQPFDLSHIRLRAVSPVHLEYLANMGVIASMSISMVRNGRLWGLVACHHSSPRLLDYRVLQGCELIADAFVWSLDARQAVMAAECLKSIHHIEAELSGQAAGGKDFRDRLAPVAPALFALTRSEGLAICGSHGIWTTGEVPSDHQILALNRWLGQVGEEQFATDRLSVEFPPAELFRSQASGIAATKIGDSWLICFRREWRHTLTWAGDPGSSNEDTPNRGHINPRTSFAAWYETVRGRSRPWTVPDKFAVDQLGTLVLRTMMHDHVRLAQERSKLEVVVQVAGGMAHELNSLLQPMVSMAQMAAEDHEDDTELVEALTVILDSARQAAEIVRGLLLYVRSSPKGSRRSWLVETVTHHVDVLRLTLPPDVSLDVRICETMIWVPVDYAEMGQIISNLADNGIHAMGGHGQLTITVDELAVPDSGPARPRVSPGRYGRLIFSDNGPGIPPAQLGRVFEPFFTTKEIGQGMGLGLSIAQGIVRSWGGDIEVNNLAEGGAALTILLPVEDQPEPTISTAGDAGPHELQSASGALG